MRVPAFVVIGVIGVVAAIGLLAYGAVRAIAQSAGSTLGVALNIARPQTPAVKGNRETRITVVPQKQVPAPVTPIVVPPLPPPQLLLWWETPLRTHLRRT